MSETIYKIMRGGEWDEAKSTSHYQGSADDLRDGFIHFSTADQLPGTIEKYYRGEAGARLLAFDPAVFPDEELKWEPSRGGALFPHLYGSMDVSKATGSWTMDVPAAGPIDLSFIKKA